MTTDYLSGLARMRLLQHGRHASSGDKIARLVLEKMKCSYVRLLASLSVTDILKSSRGVNSIYLGIGVCGKSCLYCWLPELL